MKTIFLAFFISFAVNVSAQTSTQEWVVSAGIETHQADFDTLDLGIDSSKPREQGLYLAAAIRKAFGISQKHYLGFGIDISEISNDQLIGYRALDYQYQLNNRLRVGSFFGVASLDSGLPQNGYYTGINASYFPMAHKRWSLSMELSHGNGLGRDRVAELGDPLCNCRQNDIFVDFYRAAFKFNYFFQ